MKATLGGRIVVIGVSANGSNEHAGIISRAWSEKDTAEQPVMINATVFPDCAGVMNQGSVKLHDTRSSAEAAYNADTTKMPVAYWAE